MSQRKVNNTMDVSSLTSVTEKKIPRASSQHKGDIFAPEEQREGDKIQDRGWGGVGEEKGTGRGDREFLL